MTYTRFRQIGYLLGGTYSAGGLAKSLVLTWPPPPIISVRNLVSLLLLRPISVTHGVVPPDEPCLARTLLSAGYFDVLSGPLDTSTNTEARVSAELRTGAQDR